jgi:hypothetical protein
VIDQHARSKVHTIHGALISAENRVPPLAAWMRA